MGNSALFVMFPMLAFAATGAAAQPASVDAIARCAATLAERDEFAGTVAIARGGEILFSRSYDAAGAATRPDTPHNIASMGKMFTAVAIGQLVDRGRLRFDDPVGRHLPDLPPEVGRITIAQLLSHMSGLGDFFRIENRATIEAARTARDLLGIAIAGGPRFEPGTRRSYSNSGFVLLGVVIEQLSGQSYDFYVREHVLAPAGMTRTSLARPDEAAVPMTRLAMRPGEPAPDGRRPARQGDRHASPAGGAFSTAEDMVRFAAALLANRLTRPETTAALLRGAGAPLRPGPGTAENGGYGYGFNLWEPNGTRFAGHGGGTPGANGELSFNPDGTAVAALSHYDPPSASQVTAFARRVLSSGSAAVDPALCGTLAPPPPGMRPGPARPEAPPPARPDQEL